MTETHLKNVVEAALLAAGKPLQITELAQLFEEHVRPDANALKAMLDALASDYEGRGIEIKETATGFRVQVRKELAPEISRLWPERPPRYSRALLETLALIAYRQPITRAEIEAVRGVAVNPNIVKTLLERNWVRVVGTRDVPGRPELLGTTREFLDYFGLRSLDELPPLAELKVMTDPNLQLALSTATPAAATAVEGLTEGGAAAETSEQVSATSEASVSEASASEASASEASSTQDESADQPAADTQVSEPAEAEAAELQAAELQAAELEATEPEAAEAEIAESETSEVEAAEAAAESNAGDEADIDDSNADDESDADDDADVDDDSSADEFSVDEVEAALAESEAEPADSDDDDSSTNNALSPDEEADLKLAEEADDEENREGDSAELVASRQTFED